MLRLQNIYFQKSNPERFELKTLCMVLKTCCKMVVPCLTHRITCQVPGLAKPADRDCLTCCVSSKEVRLQNK